MFPFVFYREYYLTEYCCMRKNYFSARCEPYRPNPLTIVRVYLCQISMEDLCIKSFNMNKLLYYCNNDYVSLFCDCIEIFISIYVNIC